MINRFHTVHDDPAAKEPAIKPANDPAKDPAIEKLFLNNIPLLDVRAPIEHQQGALPNCVNAPLLDDEQRHVVGKEYADKGQEAAIALALSHVTDDIRQGRLDSWTEFTNQHPEGYLFCFRGGLRSKTTQDWLREAGIDYPSVPGGYKAMRQYLIAQFERLAQHGNILVLSAPTGSGKTELIRSVSQSVDIEGLAKHRGSAFGSLFVDQPSQASWENSVAAEWLRISHCSDKAVMFESESHLIGRIALPQYLQDALRAAPVVELKTPLSDRIKNIRQDYIDTAMCHYQKTLSREDSLVQLESFISDNLGRIQRRLGGELYQRLNALVPMVIEQIENDSGTEAVDEIVQTLLHDYYDPLYAHKMIGRESQVVFTGSAPEIVDWINV